MRSVRVISVADGRPRPLWRGVIHLLAALITLPAGLGLVWLSLGRVPVVPVGLYVASSLALYATSASYHVLSKSEKVQRIMRKMDHAMIFVQIAGTYTAVCFLALPPRTARLILIPLWGLCLGGIAVKVFGGERLMRLTNALYIFVSWIAVLALPAIVRGLSSDELALLVVGGVLYTAGAFMFARRWPELRPSHFGFHEVWHTMTVAGGAAHFVLVVLLVGRVDL